MAVSKYGKTAQKNITRLIENSGMHYKDIARLTGVSEGCVHAIKDGRVTPSFDTVMKIADGLGVTLDYIYGKAEIPFDDRYSDREYFLKAVYAKAASIESRRRAIAGELPPRQDICRAYYEAGAYDALAPWPYNLMEAAFGKPDEPFDPARAIPVDDDMERGISDALDSLTKRERDTIYGIFRDGKSLEEMGKEFSLTKERVRQIKELALRKLRHPSNSASILYGHSWAAARAKRRLAEKELEIAERDLSRAKKAKEGIGDDSTQGIRPDRGPDDIWSLGISVRTYNALKRTGIRTVGDLLRFVDENGYKGLMKIRNLGRKSYMEITDKLEEFYEGRDHA